MAFVQAAKNGGSGTAANTRAATFGVAVTAGNAVYGTVTWGSATNTDLTTVTDTAGNSYTILDRTTDGTNGQSAAQFYGYNLTGGFTVITANFSSSLTYTGISVQEHSGWGTTDPIDGTNHTGVVSAAPGTGANGLNVGSNFTPSTTGCTVMGGGVDTGAINNTGASEFAAGTNFTEPANAEHQVSGEISLSSEYWVQTTATATNAPWTVAQNSGHIAFIAVFKPSGGGGGTPNTYKYQEPLPVGWYVDPGYAAIWFSQNTGISVSNRSVVTITGTLARTTTNDTSTSAGTTTIVGTLSRTVTSDTSSASGSVGNPISGSLSYTNSNDTSSGQGTTTILGTLAVTTSSDTSTGTAFTTIIGVLSYTNKNDVASASGFPGTQLLRNIHRWIGLAKRNGL